VVTWRRTVIKEQFLLLSALFGRQTGWDRSGGKSDIIKGRAGN
jgi:hypothetical protein